MTIFIPREPKKRLQTRKYCEKREKKFLDISHVPGLPFVRSGVAVGGTANLVSLTKVEERVCSPWGGENDWSWYGDDTLELRLPRQRNPDVGSPWRFPFEA